MASPPFNLPGKWKHLIPGDVAIVMVEQQLTPSGEGWRYGDVPAESPPQPLAARSCQELLILLQALRLKTTNR